MSTLGVPTIEAIADVLGRRGVGVLDTPVTGGGGGPHGVQAGTLATMSAGPRQIFERVRPILSALTKNVFYVGDKPGMAQVCKMVNNAISIAGLTMACEAMVMGVKAGIDATCCSISSMRAAAAIPRPPTSSRARSCPDVSPMAGVSR
jgi:3-hydroxyisobutyrate dehydrogenase-like beta-hydroxyacid dehydrogenase